MGGNPVSYWAGMESEGRRYKEYPYEAIEWQKNTERWKDFENETWENRSLAAKLLNEAPSRQWPVKLRIGRRDGRVLTTYAIHMFLRCWMNRLEEHDPRAPEVVDWADWVSLEWPDVVEEIRKIDPMFDHVIEYMMANDLPVWRQPLEPDSFPPNHEVFLEEIEIDENEGYLDWSRTIWQDDLVGP